jgi:DNA-directed RNA polymerase beta subunit
MGVNGLNFADGTDSSPRKQMFSSHIGQSLVIRGGTERFIQTGMEREYAKYTFSVSMPEDGKILRAIDRYKETMGADSISSRNNPQTVLIYEAHETGQLGVINLPRYFSDQTYFGFEYKQRKNLSDAFKRGTPIGKGFKFLDSPAVSPQGDYHYGRECKVAYMSLPSVAEDGIMVCEDILPYFTIKTYERREVEWGSRYIPLNLYGDAENYKPFPEIGDRIRADGLLMALRRDDRSIAAIEQSARALMDVDFFHDRRVYAAGEGGKVVDIRVYHDDYNTSNTPEAMERQVMRYHRATQRFYQEVVDTVKDIEKERGGPPALTPQLHALLVEAHAMLDNRTNGAQERRVLLHRKNPLDDWRVEFVIEYETTPTVGFKWTDCHGGKGVICKVAKPEEMPVDENGVRADIVMDGLATVSRMNWGRMYEQYINATSAHVLDNIRARLNLSKKDAALQTKIEQMEVSDPAAVNEAWDYLLGFFKIVSPERMYRWFTEGKYSKTRAQYLASIIPEEAIIIYWPPENEPEFPDVVRQIEADKRYTPHYGPVTYVGNSGRTVTTKNKVRIGSVYIIMLEKIADDWTAVASGKLQHFGVLSQITSWDKYSSPSRNQAIRSMGESEVRIWVSFAGERVTADVMDRNNNPKTRRAVLDSILNADKPTNIEQVVDRRVVPYGGSKPLQLVKHMGMCGGWQFHYQPYDVKVTYSPTFSEE